MGSGVARDFCTLVSRVVCDYSSADFKVRAPLVTKEIPHKDATNLLDQITVGEGATSMPPHFLVRCYGHHYPKQTRRAATPF